MCTFLLRPLGFLMMEHCRFLSLSKSVGPCGIANYDSICEAASQSKSINEGSQNNTVGVSKVFWDMNGNLQFLRCDFL
jgi:hypothetical protein